MEMPVESVSLERNNEHISEWIQAIYINDDIGFSSNL